MKKGAVLFLVVFLAASLVAAAEGDVLGSGESADVRQAAAQAQQTTNQKLAQQITIPEKYGVFFQILFGLKGNESIQLQQFIVLIAMWIVLFMVIIGGMRFVPMISEGWKPWVFGIVLTLVLSVVGTVQFMAQYFFDLGNIFAFAERWGLLRLALVLVLLAVLAFMALHGMSLIKKKTEIQNAVQTGYDIALERATAKAARKMAKSLR